MIYVCDNVSGGKATFNVNGHGTDTVAKYGKPKGINVGPLDVFGDGQVKFDGTLQQKRLATALTDSIKSSQLFWPADSAQTFTMDITSPLGAQVRDGGNVDLKYQEGTNWVKMAEAYSYIRPGSALDFSRRRTTGSPAGRYGQVVRRGTHFEFADKLNEPQRFFGVNFDDKALTNASPESVVRSPLSRS